MRGVEKFSTYQANNIKPETKNSLVTKGQSENINMQTKTNAAIPPLSSRKASRATEGVSTKRKSEGVDEPLKSKKQPSSEEEIFDPTTKESREKFQKEVEEAMPQFQGKQKENIDEDVDLADEFDPTLLGIYVKEIFAYLTVVEKHSGYPLNGVTTSVPAKHIEYVTNGNPARPFSSPVALGTADYGINSYQRAKVIDFVSSIHSRMSLCNESIFLCVQFIDRVNYLEGALGRTEGVSRQAGRYRTQKRLIDSPMLLALTCLFIANKYEDRYSPRLKDFVHYSGNKFVPQEIVECERRVLKLLDYSLQCPTPIVFLRRYCRIDDTPTRERYMSFLVGEMCFRSPVLCSLRPSLLAAAILGYVNKITGRKIWNEKLAVYSNIQEEDIAPVMKNIERFVKDHDRSFHTSVRNKYTLPRYHGAWDNMMKQV